MREMKKRILAIALTLMMAVAFMPTFAFAAPAPKAGKAADIQKTLGGLEGQFDAQKGSVKDLQAKIAELSKELKNSEKSTKEAEELYKQISDFIIIINNYAVEQAAKVDYNKVVRDAMAIYQQNQEMMDQIGELTKVLFTSDASDEGIAAKEAALFEFEKYLDEVIQNTKEFQEAYAFLMCDKTKEAISDYIKSLETLQQVIVEIDKEIKAELEAVKAELEVIDQKIKDGVDKAAEELKALNEKIKADLEALDQKIMNEYAMMCLEAAMAIEKACEYMYEHSIDDIIAELNEMVCEAIEWVKNYEFLTPEQKAELMAILAKCQAMVDDIVADLEAQMAQAKACFDMMEAYLDEAIDALKECSEQAAQQAAAKIAEAMEAMQAMIEELQPYVEQAVKDLNEFVMKAAAELEKDLAELDAQIKEFILEEAQDIQEAVQKVVEIIGSGVIPEMVEQIEAVVEELEALAEDVVAYAVGYASGEPYTKLQADLAEAKAEAAALDQALDEAIKIIDAASDEIAKLESELATAQADLKTVTEELILMKEGDSIYKWNLENAKDLTKAKIKQKGTKAKKKKITVKWKKADENVDKYVVSYKVGKKTTTKSVANDKTSYKIPKKFKKGQTVKVKVKAVYNLDYQGVKIAYSSKWSKTKKVKIK